MSSCSVNDDCPDPCGMDCVNGSCVPRQCPSTIDCSSTPTHFCTGYTCNSDNICTSSGPDPTTCDPNKQSDCIDPDKCVIIPGYSDDKYHCYSTEPDSLGCKFLKECNGNEECCVGKCPVNSPGCPNDCAGGCNSTRSKEKYTSFYGSSVSDKTAGIVAISIVAFIGLLVALNFLYHRKKK